MAAATPARASPFSLAGGAAGLAALLRGLVLAIASPVLERVLYRLCLGRWPTGPEARLFGAGLRDQGTPLPPACRAMLTVPAGRLQLSRVLLVDMVRNGAIVPTDPFDVSGANPAETTLLPAQSGNPLAFWHGPPIAFLHLEKTAGISLAKLLTEMFHPAQIDPDPQRTVAPHLATPFAGRPAAAIRRHALVYGHYDLPSLRRLDSDRIIITMLRDPAARILSLYYYWRSIDLAVLRRGGSYGAVERAHRCGLLGFITTDDPSVRDHIDNFYVRRLTGLYGTGARSDRVTDAPDLALAAALRGLRQIDFVGITEQMGPSVAALGAFLGFTPPELIPQENTAAANPAIGQGVFSIVPREPLTPAHWRQLGRLTRLDTVIYRAACDQLAKHGGVATAHYAGQWAAG